MCIRDSPLWYLNLVDEPRVTLQVGAETFDARARTATAVSYTHLDVYKRQVDSGQWAALSTAHCPLPTAH